MGRMVARMIMISWWLPLVALAQPNDHYHKGFYWALGLGVGKVKQNFYDEPGSQNRFGMSFTAGYFIKPWVQLGLTAGGWSYEPENMYDWTKGVYISNSVAHVRFYPITYSGLYAGGGYGFSSYTNRNPGSNPQYSTGPGYLLNAGYDHIINRKIGLFMGARLAYQWGRLHDFPLFEATNRNFSVWELMLTFGID